MKVIGITGGVGAGKSEVIRIIKDMCSCVVVIADELAKSLEKKGEVCYEPLLELLGDDVLGADGEIDPKKMAAKIFAPDAKGLLADVNATVHPAVKARILQMIDEAEREGAADYFFIEAALLIEDHYDTIVDELWYIYADEDIRRGRLKETRGYTDRKIDELMRSQSSDEVFRQKCAIVIDNSGTIAQVKKQLEEIL